MLQKESQNCQMWIDLRTENGFRVRNGQGLRICNYFYRMAYSLGIGIGRFRRRCVVILLYSKRIVYVLHAVWGSSVSVLVHVLVFVLVLVSSRLKDSWPDYRLLATYRVERLFETWIRHLANETFKIHLQFTKQPYFVFRFFLINL